MDRVYSRFLALNEQLFHSFPQESPPDERSLDLRMIQLHQLSSDQSTFNNPRP